MVQINDKLISYLEELSCLTLTEAEKQRVSDDLEKILGGMGKLNELETGDTDQHNTAHENVMRDDVVRPSLERELILKNAPNRNEKMFVAPKTVE